MVIALRVTLGKQCIVQGPLYVQFFFLEHLCPRVCSCPNILIMQAITCTHKFSLTCNPYPYLVLPSSQLVH